MLSILGSLALSVCSISSRQIKFFCKQAHTAAGRAAHREVCELWQLLESSLGNLWAEVVGLNESGRVAVEREAEEPAVGRERARRRGAGSGLSQATKEAVSEGNVASSFERGRTGELRAGGR